MGFGESNLKDIKSRKFWTALVAELLGTMLLVLFACGSTEYQGQGPDLINKPSFLHIAIAFGLAVASIVWAIGAVSGGHINPGVTIGFLLTRRISLVRGLLYIVFQTVGAIVGAGLLYALTPENRNNLKQTLGAVSLNVSVGQGFGVELLITFVFVFVIFACVDGGRRDLGGSVPLTVGLALALCHLWAIPFTGSGMNPARSFGPALILGAWENHWVYWVGPLVGGTLGAFFYDFIFAVNATPAKLRGFFTADYDNDNYDSQGRITSESNGTEMKP